MSRDNDVSTKQDTDLATSLLLSLIEDYHDFNPETTIPIYPYPTDLQFSQQVARGRPCVYWIDRSVLNTRASLDTRVNGDGDVHEREWQRLRPPVAAKDEKLIDGQRSILSAPCFQWTRKKLCELDDGDVEVAVTPDGRADSLYALPGKRRSTEDDGTGDGDDGNNKSEQVFLQPATTHMTMSRLINELCPSESASPSRGFSSKPVYYLQSQDSNLSRPELSSLIDQLPTTPPSFALPTLGDPEATNIWIGNAQSVTSTHRDPYENLYLVVKGLKKFVLYPPVEEVCLHAQMVRTGKWDHDEKTGTFEIVMDDEASNGEIPPSSRRSNEHFNTTTNEAHTSPRIPWIPIDPLRPPPPSSTTYPYYHHASPLTVTVSEGEILYLPAGWFHHVSQECGQWEDGTTAPCIAVNYWFDMDYSGEKHIMREMVGRLVERVRLGSGTAR